MVTALGGGQATLLWPPRHNDLTKQLKDRVPPECQIGDCQPLHGGFITQALHNPEDTFKSLHVRSVITPVIQQRAVKYYEEEAPFSDLPRNHCAP